MCRVESNNPEHHGHNRMRRELAIGESARRVRSRSEELVRKDILRFPAGERKKKPTKRRVKWKNAEPVRMQY